MTREEKVVNFYVLCNKLKNVVRTGWKNWKVQRKRVESVAEHIYSVQMLAIAMHSEYGYDIDLTKVIFMLAIHELGETVIGDLTLYDISREEKSKIEKEAVKGILSGLLEGEEIEKLFLEFEERKTKEAKFAYQCDKLECDLQCKCYDEEGCVDLNNQHGNVSLKDENVCAMLNSGMSWSEMWLKCGQVRYNYDENFTAVSNYAMSNHITK